MQQYPQANNFIVTPGHSIVFSFCQFFKKPFQLPLMSNWPMWLSDHFTLWIIAITLLMTPSDYSISLLQLIFVWTMALMRSQPSMMLDPGAFVWWTVYKVTITDQNTMSWQLMEQIGEPDPNQKASTYSTVQIEQPVFIWRVSRQVLPY